jgi:hypothetical protein
MQANTDIELKDRSTLKLSNFRGVDFSSSPLQVKTNRASSMRNFINKYGVNRKRNGWNELAKIELLNNSKRPAQRINCIFQFINGTHKEIIVQAGKRFYRLSVNTNGEYLYEDITLSSTYEDAKCDLALLKDQRSQVFFNKSKAYIIGCGDYLVYGSWDSGSTYELRRVYNNEDTYIPTTTISIDDDSNDTDIRASLDNVNLLSSKRINQMLGTNVEDVDNGVTWTVDTGCIDKNTDVRVEIETLDGDNTVTIVVSNDKSDKTILYDDGDCAVGKIDFSTGKITLYIATTPQIENRDNIYVTFEYTQEGYLERILNCNFGILFGVNGNTDRLFLSGNSDYPNIEFFSEMDDFTYFCDLNTASMGSDSVAINGFGRLSDSTLVVYKGESGQEATIFYQTGQYETTYDSSGNIDTVQGEFPFTAGSIGEGVVSRYACANFAGDNLILSNNGVFGIVLGDNVAVTERYVRERSRSINEKLKEHDLSEAVGIVFQNKYYLAVDGVCYIADSRYKYTSEDDIDGSYNYEWWYWDNIPARVWANIDNKLYFGTDDGRICVFDDEYTDRTYYTITESGYLSFNQDNSTVTYDVTDIGELSENDILKISKLTYQYKVDPLPDEEGGMYYETDCGLHSLFASDVKVSGNKIISTDDEIVDIHDGIEVYAGSVSESGLGVGTAYYIYDVDYGECTYKLKDSKGNAIEFNSDYEGGFYLYEKLLYRDLYITNVVDGTFQLKLYKNSKPITLLHADNLLWTAHDICAKIAHIKNVVAEWYTPVLDLGTNESSEWEFAIWLRNAKC